jgi:hypothetical protein
MENMHRKMGPVIQQPTPPHPPPHPTPTQIATMDNMHRKMESVIQQLLARSAKLVILCNAGDPAMDQFEGRGCTLVRVPRSVDALQPIVNIVPLQLLSYHLTTIRCASPGDAAMGVAGGRGGGHGLHRLHFLRGGSALPAPRLQRGFATRPPAAEPTASSPLSPPCPPPTQRLQRRPAPQPRQERHRHRGLSAPRRRHGIGPASFPARVFMFGGPAFPRRRRPCLAKHDRGAPRRERMPP